MRTVLSSFTVCLLVVLALFATVDMEFEITKYAKGATIYVGGSNPGNYSTIQEGIDAAKSGDTVYVYYSGSPYVETVNLNYPIYLVGDSPSPTIEGSVFVYAPDCLVKGFRFQDGGVVVYDDYSTIESNTIIGGTGGIGVHLESSVGHLVIYNDIWSTDVGIRSWSGDHSRIDGNEIHDSAYSGIELEATSVIVENNNIYNSDFFGGIYTYMMSDDITISNNTLADSDIIISDSSEIRITNNNLFRSSLGISASFFGIDIEGNTFSSDNTDTAVWSDMGSQFNMKNTSISNYQNGFGTTQVTAILTNCIITNTMTGVDAYWSDLLIIDSSIVNSSSYDVQLHGDQDPPGTYITMINTYFNKSKVNVQGSNSTLEVKWYLDVNVKDSLGNPVPDAYVKVEDNINGTFENTLFTGPDGFVAWTVTEYIQNSSFIINYTPHKLVAWNDTTAGYANPYMDMSKIVNITLRNGTILNLSRGWNLISIPVVLSDININTILQSIDGQYNAVQWFNASDSSDKWKHYHVSKPSHMNDLLVLNHTMGFWVHITDPGGTSLVLNGPKPSVLQNITLHQGWNLVGYPSLSNKNRTNALNNLTFDMHVDSIWTFNAGTQKWDEIKENDYFEVGRGYWIHAKSDHVWEVPL